MKHYVGLDISVKETSVCVIFETGAVCRELKVYSHSEDIVRALKNLGWRVVRIGLEAGPLSQWLFSGLVEAGMPAICIETRHAKAFLKAQVNKTDRNDAKGITQMMQPNIYRPVHVKTLISQQRRVMLTARRLLQEKAIAIENDIRGLLRNFGIKVGIVGVIGFNNKTGSSLKSAQSLVGSWNLCWPPGTSFVRHSWNSTASCFRSCRMTRPADV